MRSEEIDFILSLSPEERGEYTKLYDDSDKEYYKYLKRTHSDWTISQIMTRVAINKQIMSVFEGGATIDNASVDVKLSQKIFREADKWLFRINPELHTKISPTFNQILNQLDMYISKGIYYLKNLWNNLLEFIGF